MIESAIHTLFDKESVRNEYRIEDVYTHIIQYMIFTILYISNTVMEIENRIDSKYWQHNHSRLFSKETECELVQLNSF